jgi:hypothetical protein
MIFKNEFTLGDIATTCGTLLAAIALLFTLWQVRRASAQSRSEFAANVVFRFLDDSGACAMFYRLAHQKPSFETIKETRDEVNLDKLLYHFETIGSLYYMGAITFNDVLLLDYEITQVYRNSAVSDYLTYLDPFCIEVVGDCAFPRFRCLAEDIAEYLRTHPTRVANSTSAIRLGRLTGANKRVPNQP